MSEKSSMQRLLDTLPQVGHVTWLGTRPTKNEPMVAVDAVEVLVGSGLVGDRYKSSATGKREVTLIQQEHLTAIGAFLQRGPIEPCLLRRNVVISGINLLALKDKQFRIGSAILAYTGLCHPCSKMEKALGPGGYNAMRGHGGITARVVQSGTVAVEDSISYIPISN